MEKKRGRIRSLADDKEFPGYPMYAPNEDIMKKGKRLEGSLDDERLEEVKSKPAHLPSVIERVEVPGEIEDREMSTSESDLTSEDMEALGPKDLSLDMNDDEQLKHRTTPVDFSGKDLDIPGSELDDSSESVASEDEENNSYSLGGDNHNDLEEARD